MCMMHNHGSKNGQHDRSSGQSPLRWYKSPVGLTLLALAVLLGYYLWVYQHVLAFLPVMFILACPLMHLLIHRNHTRHQPEPSPNETPKSSEAIIG